MPRARYHFGPRGGGAIVTIRLGRAGLHLRLYAFGLLPLYALFLMPYASYPMPYAFCFVPYASYPMPYAFCFVPYAYVSCDRNWQYNYAYVDTFPGSQV